MRRLAIPLAILTCAVIGAAGAVDPRVFAAVPVLCGFAALCALAYRRPRAAISLSMLLVPIAATKVRNRDPQASLLHPVDDQILLEVGLYAVIGLIAVLAALGPDFSARRLGARERALTAFVALALASTLWSEAPMLTLVRAVQLATLLVLALVAVRVLDVGGTIDALGSAIVGYVLVCAGIAAAFPSTRVTSSYTEGVVALASERFSWFAMHSISAATLTAIAILYVLCVLLFLPGGWRRRWAGIPIALTLVPLGAIMVATNSRGPLFALMGTIVALVGLRAFRPVVSLALAALASVGMLAASITGITPASVLEDASRSNSRLASLVLRGQDLREFSTLTGRTELWSSVIPLVLERPVVGYGYLGSREALLRVAPWAGHAHNGFLQTLLDLGIVGTLLLWTPFFLTLFARPRARSPAPVVVRWASATVFAASAFSLLDSLSDVGIAGSPGYEILLFLCCVVAAERLAAGEATAAERLGGYPSTVWAGRTTSPVA